MKTMLEVCMYSGAVQWDPRCEITPDQEKVLMEKVNKLHKLAEPNRFGTGVLGQDSFLVIWGITDVRDDGFDMVQDYQEFARGLNVVHIRALPGRITVCKLVGNDWTDTMYEDTESIHSFLTDLAAPAIQASYKRAQEQIQAYWDNYWVKD